MSVRCKLGYFNLDPNNPQGCTPCFCFQHSSVCGSAEGFSVHAISSSFDRGKGACSHNTGQIKRMCQQRVDVLQLVCVCVCVLGDEQWSGQQRDGSSVAVQWSDSEQEISLISDDYLPMYFVAPGTHTHTHTFTCSVGSVIWVRGSQRPGFLRLIICLS